MRIEDLHIKNQTIQKQQEKNLKKTKNQNLQKKLEKNLKKMKNKT